MPKRKRGETITFDQAYAVFSSIYNRSGYSELQCRESAREHWQEQHQALVRPSERKLLWRRLGQQWKPTITYSNCRKGGTKNLTHRERAEINRATKLLMPPDERQVIHVEEEAITALRQELLVAAERLGLPSLRWKSMPTGLKADVLVQRADTATPDLWTALQIKSCTHKSKGQMMFTKTAAYEIPLLCLSIDEGNIAERLLFKTVIRRKAVYIHHGKRSRDSEVEAAKTTSSQVLRFIAGIPSAEQRTRNEWVYGPGQCNATVAIWLEVQNYCEALLGEELKAPSAQGTPVHAYASIDGKRVAISFKMATPRGPGFQINLGATKHDKVDVFVVGFRDASDKVAYLGVVRATSIACTKKFGSYYWSSTTPFAGILDITTGEQLRAALRSELKR